MKSGLAFIVAAGVSLTAIAQTEWINVGDTDSSIWDIQAGSLEEGTTKGGTPIAAVVGRVTTKSTRRIDVRKWYVPISDCNRGMGKLVTLDIDGNYRYESDVVFGAGSIGSSVAEMICGAYKQTVVDRKNKGL